MDSSYSLLKAVYRYLEWDGICSAIFKGAVTSIISFIAAEVLYRLV